MIFRRKVDPPGGVAGIPAKPPGDSGRDEDLNRTVRLLEMSTRRLVDSVFTGEYASVFKGHGMEFAEVREYVVGDEVRTIDWNVTARMNRPFVKRYVEERELTVMLLVDQSASGGYATVGRTKSATVLQSAALLTMAALRNNDRVGAILFTDRIEHVVRPAKGRRHGLRLLRDIAGRSPSGSRTDLREALECARRVLRQRAVIFVVSDFQASDYESSLKRLAHRHDVVAVTVSDPSEKLLPSVGIVTFSDPETGTLVELDTSDQRVQLAFRKRILAAEQARSGILQRLGIDEVALRTDVQVAHPFLRLFRMRSRRRPG